MSAYVFRCVGCRLLDLAERRGKIACSTACRVRACRNGSAKALRDLASGMKIEPALIAQASAIEALRPDLIEKIRAGAMELDDAQPEAVLALSRLALAAAGGLAQ